MVLPTTEQQRASAGGGFELFDAVAGAPPVGVLALTAASASGAGGGEGEGAAAAGDLWVATLSSDVRRVSTTGRSSSSTAAAAEVGATIRGLPAIAQHAVLNDRRHVLTRDDRGGCTLWDLTKGRAVREIGACVIVIPHDARASRCLSFWSVDFGADCVAAHT